MSNSNLLRGTFILTLGTYISRLLGMIYVFPFFALVGEQGAALYGYGYIPYTIFLSISTIGVPMAVSKFVSKYNALGDYETSRRLFRLGMKIMLVTGFLSFSLLYLIAPFLATIILDGKNLLNSVEDVTNVIRMVSFALLVVPVMSIIRGFFQGNQSMEPTAISQVIEQLVRIVFLLGSVYFIIEVSDGELSVAVGFATFAAFIGAIGGLTVMAWFWRKRKEGLDLLLEQSKTHSDFSSKEMIKELLRYAAPFVIVGLAIPLYQVVDTFTFHKAMLSIGNSEKTSEFVLSMIQFTIPKLVMIPVSLATAFGLTLVPAITKAFTNKDQNLLHTQINQSFQVVFFLTLPAVVGLSVLSDELYAMFYKVDELGSNLLAIYAPIAILFAFFTITSAILQGIQKQKLAIISLCFGLLLKIIFNVPLILMFEGVGSILATGIGYLGSVIYSLAMIKRHSSFSYRMVVKRSALMVVISFLMLVGINLILWVSNPWLVFSDGRWEAIVLTLLGVLTGSCIYLYLSYRTNLAGKLLGARFSVLKRQKANG